MHERNAGDLGDLERGAGRQARVGRELVGLPDHLRPRAIPVIALGQASSTVGPLGVSVTGNDSAATSIQKDEANVSMAGVQARKTPFFIDIY